MLEYMKGGIGQKASSNASSSGEHVQLFRMVYHCKKGFQAEHLSPPLPPVRTTPMSEQQEVLFQQLWEPRNFVVPFFNRQ